MQFDDFYETVGMFGPYQKVKYFLLCCTNMLPPVMVYAWTFIAATPSFQCQVPSSNSFVSWTIPDSSQCETSQKHISLKECQRCFRFVNKTDPLGSSNGQLMACQNFSFSRAYYESTVVEDWSMVCDRVSMKSNVQIVFFAGYMVGSLFFGVLSDKYGRRPIMGVSFVLMFIAGIVCALAPEEFFGFGTTSSYWLFVIGRFFVACATRGIAVTGFIIGSEIVGPKQRLFAGIVIKYFFALGELLLLAIAYYIRTWRTLNAVLAVVPVPFIFFYFILPESPRWLVSKQRYEDAEILLRHIAERNKKEFNAAKYERFVQEDKKRGVVDLGARNKVKAMFRSKVMAIIAINMSYQWFVQNIVFYGISQNTGAWLKNPYLSFGIAAFVEIAAYGVAHMTLDRVGRKIPYCSFVVALAMVALLVVPIQIFIPKDQQTLMIAVNIILKFLASGSYVIIYIYANETFPTQGRNTGMGVCSMIGRLGAIIGTFSNDNLTRVWIHFPIVLYGVTSLFAVSLATIFPETLDEPLPQTIEDVERMGLACSFRTPNRKHPGHLNGGHKYVEDDLLKKHLKEDNDC